MSLSDRSLLEEEKKREEIKNFTATKKSWTRVDDVVLLNMDVRDGSLLNQHRSQLQHARYIT